MIHAALAVAKPGDVIVVDGKGDLSSALMGEIMCQQAVTPAAADLPAERAGHAVDSAGPGSPTGCAHRGRCAPTSAAQRSRKPLAHDRPA